MESPGEAPPFRRLRHILTRDALGDPEREAARQTMSPEFERVALSPGWSPALRLAALTEMARLAQDAPLAPRDKRIVIHELSRLALRVLWWEGLLGPGMVQELAPDIAAAALVELCAGGFLPEGPAGRMVLERARVLLAREDVIKSLRENTPRRERLLRQLIEAEARLHPLAL